MLVTSRILGLYYTGTHPSREAKGAKLGVCFLTKKFRSKTVSTKVDLLSHGCYSTVTAKIKS